MDLNEDWFYHGTEGFIGKPEDCKVLFLMREPNCGDDGMAEDNKFWFKMVVGGAKMPWGECYKSKLGRIASLILDDKAGETNDEWVCALKKCVYINVNPITGKGTKSYEYGKALDLFAEGPNAECSLLWKGQNYYYPNRWNTILNMPNGSTIVTVGDVYTKMFDWFEKQGKIVSVNTSFLYIKTKTVIRSMRSFVFKHDNRSINVIEMYHPAARGNNNYQWSDVSLCRWQR